MDAVRAEMMAIAAGGPMPSFPQAQPQRGARAGPARAQAPHMDALRLARIARIEGRPAPAAAPAPAPARASASARWNTDNTTTTTSRARRAPAAAPVPTPAAARAAPPPPVRMPPTGAERAAKVVCPSCRYRLSHEPPIKVFALSTVCEMVRAAEKAGGALASESEDGKAGLTDDEAELIDENDKTWGGLFHDTSKVLTTREKRARDARPMRDDDDDVWRCGGCNWEVNKQSGECTNEQCGRTWDTSLLDEEEGSGDDLMNPAGRGGLTFGAGDGDRSEDERSEDEELDSEDEGFIDDGAGSVDGSDASDDESARSTPEKKARGSFAKRKEDRRRRLGKNKSAEVIDVGSTEEEEDSSSTSSSSNKSARIISKRNRFVEITESEDDDSEEADTSLEIVANNNKNTTKTKAMAASAKASTSAASQAKNKKWASSELEEEEDEEEEVAQPPAKRHGAARGATKPSEAKPAETAKGKRRRVIQDSDE